jgi:hypothetical protein
MTGVTILAKQQTPGMWPAKAVRTTPEHPLDAVEFRVFSALWKGGGGRVKKAWHRTKTAKTTRQGPKSPQHRHLRLHIRWASPSPGCATFGHLPIYAAQHSNSTATAGAQLCRSCTLHTGIPSFGLFSEARLRPEGRETAIIRVRWHR